MGMVVDELSDKASYVGIADSLRAIFENQEH